MCTCEYDMHSLICLLPGPTVCPYCERVELVYVSGLWRNTQWSCRACEEECQDHPSLIASIMDRLRACGECFWEKEAK